MVFSESLLTCNTKTIIKWLACQCEVQIVVFNQVASKNSCILLFLFSVKMYFGNLSVYRTKVKTV